jgi:SAM-dependent methyltransferase
MSSSADPPDPNDYVLGHTSGELRRLSMQARLIDPITRGFLLEAGIAPGMRVLDVGSGGGDVSFLAADLVGDSGEVVGVDRSGTAVETARAKAETLGLTHVSFAQGDPADLRRAPVFDAAIGRYVLQFQHDPGDLLREVASRVRPGGVIAFHELDWSGARSVPAAPTHDRCCTWAIQTLELSGTETHMGAKLPAAFRSAGLPPPLLRLESLIGAGPHASDLVDLVSSLTETLAPTMESLGLATAADLDIPTLGHRMLAEVVDNNCLLFGRWQIAAWCQIPI